METLMRLTPIVLTLAIAGTTIASAGYGQRADDQINPRSAALVAQARPLTASGRYEDANNLLETALAVDPRNRAAYIALGRVAQAQHLPGKALRYYSDALQIEPNDIEALSAQGEAFVQRGAVDRARANLTRVRALCRQTCPQGDQLAQVIQRGPPAEVLAAQRPDQGAPTEAPQPQHN
jgi:tetratricopeptide (TPR) repeat protein